MASTPLPRLLALTLLSPFLLPAATVEDRLADLETKLQTLSSENAALKQKLGVDAKGNPPVFVTAAGKVQRLSIGGYLHLQGEMGDAPDERFPVNDRFLIRRARISLRGSFAEDVNFTLMPEFGNGNLGTTSNYRTQLIDAFVTWKKFDFANVTFGQFKTPYGHEQLLPDTRTPFIERSLPNDRLTLGRQIGLMASGEIVADRLDYSVGAFNGNGPNQGNNDNENFLVVGRLAGTAFQNEKLKLTVAANTFTTEDGPAATSVQREGYGLDAQLRAGRFDAGAEWLQIDYDPTTGADSTAEGIAAHVAFFVLEKKLQALLRFESYDPHTGVPANSTELWTLGLNYYLKGDDLKLMLNYLLGDPVGPLDDQGRLLFRAQVIF